MKSHTGSRSVPKSNPSLQALFAREKEHEFIHVGVVGAGAYGRTLISQLLRMPGIHPSAVCDVDLEAAVAAFNDSGYEREVQHISGRNDARRAISAGVSIVLDDLSLLADVGLQVIVDCTGDPDVGAKLSKVAAAGGNDLVMVNVEADATVGAEAAALVERAGGIYTLADGDQPSLLVGLVDWAAGIGFEVVTVGKWTDAYSMPEADALISHWESLGKTIKESDLTYLDGTKAQLEMASTANCLGFGCDVPGMHGESLGLSDIPERLRYGTESSVLSKENVVEYVNCTGLAEHQCYPGGVFVVVRSDNYLGMDAMANKHCVVSNDRTHAMFYRPYHLIGVETVRSIVRAAVERVPTAAPGAERNVEVVAVAKRHLESGIRLNGLGGDARGVVVSREEARSRGLLPVGLVEGCELRADYRSGDYFRISDVIPPDDSACWDLRTDLTPKG